MMAAPAALCAHGFELALCRDEQRPEVREAVDFAHRHAFAYAAERVGTSAIESLDDAEEFATYVAQWTARRDGELDGSLRVELEEWISSRSAA